MCVCGCVVRVSGCVRVAEFGFFPLAMILSFFYSRFVGAYQVKMHHLRDTRRPLKGFEIKTSVVSTMRINTPNVAVTFFLHRSHFLRIHVAKFAKGKQ